MKRLNIWEAAGLLLCTANLASTLFAAHLHPSLLAVLRCLGLPGMLACIIGAAIHIRTHAAAERTR